MPPKSTGHITDPSLCVVATPGPKYKLKALVGHKSHCISKERGPAYTIGVPRPQVELCRSPGPVYNLPGMKPNGFVHGLPTNIINKTVSPGPKYFPQPPPRRPAYSVKWRTRGNPGFPTPGAYPMKSTLNGPAFKIGMPYRDLKCPGGPGPSVRFPLETVKPRAPAYSFGLPTPIEPLCRSPGPKYRPKLYDFSYKYSFGVKHSLCSPPNIVPCDDRC